MTRYRIQPDGAKVAIVGAGPAGTMLAIALLDLAKARRCHLEVTLFHGGEPGPGRVLVDPLALGILAAAGLQLPEFATSPLEGAVAIAGGARAPLPLSLFATHRAILVEHLRLAAEDRGAVVRRRAVDEIRRAGGGFTVRAAGASLRMDAVVLACGAGSPLAARIEGHRPPPLWRACQAELEGDGSPELQASIARIHGAVPLPELWLLRCDGGEQVLAVGPDAGPAALVEALLCAVASGTVPPLRPREPRRIHLPVGVARPSLPTLGDALGGAPHPFRLGRALAQAQTLAAAFFDGGAEAMLAATRAETLRLDAATRRHIRRDRRWKGRPHAAVERALAQEAARPPAWRPVHRALASTAAPPDAGATRLFDGLRALLAILLAWLLVGREADRPAPRRSSGAIYVVDDDADAAELLCSYLEGRGFRCQAFTDGVRAVGAAAREPPAAVILDVALPWIDGAVICRVLRRHAEAPVFLATALPLALARPQGEAAGATDVLSKPLDLAGLALRLEPHVAPAERRPDDAGLPARDAARPPG